MFLSYKLIDLSKMVS